MGSIRRERGTFGSNKKPFAGGNEIDIGTADLGSQSLPSFGSRVQSMWDNNTFRTPSPPADLFQEESSDPLTEIEELYGDYRRRLDSKRDSMQRLLEAAARGYARIRELQGITGPESDHPARAGLEVGRMHEARRGRARRDPRINLPVKPGRDHPLRVDRRLSMNHFNSTAPRNRSL